MSQAAGAAAGWLTALDPLAHEMDPLAVIRWEGHRRWSTGESRGSGTVALSEDGIVLLGQRRESGSNRAIPVKLTLTRRGRILETSVVGDDNRVYFIVVTRHQ